jgi:hypothetical protein
MGQSGRALLRVERSLAYPLKAVEARKGLGNGVWRWRPPAILSSLQLLPSLWLAPFPHPSLVEMVLPGCLFPLHNPKHRCDSK